MPLGFFSRFKGEKTHKGKNNGLNVVVHGQTGAGVSSLVNLIVGGQPAKVAADRASAQCTKELAYYSTSFEGKEFNIYDSPGFNGLDASPSALPNHTDLVIVCTRADVQQTKQTVTYLKKAWKYGKDVPVLLLAVQVPPVENWWAGTGKACFDRVPGEVKCATPVRESITWTDGDASQCIRSLIARYCPPRS
ncbi:hypothetical protein HYDPIDRAFT_170507 [Hydnomerulius pinastri MD-312]|uniref:G domain-containing protein n=1 Tax=Hydnomerulius pinastri MD-312 TaxID=994086 RepID=A0A0C9V3M2_9AGAM|nr:hypothetical protein HYDPIDRAFT_170507 [Hydnomerulius pinastri MD-312]